MRFLFYIVHPSKYHLFRYTINKLKEFHRVDIIINSKDVLEALIKQEGWQYTNIFPKGRNISKKPSVIKSGLKFILTIIRLEKYLWRKASYDVFVTDDTLVVNGWFRTVSTYIFNDNDIETIKINKILFFFASKIISPESTDLGHFEEKKISFKGNKALAHLHPIYFRPNIKILQGYNIVENSYCILRVAKLNATHDINNSGITNEILSKIIYLVSTKYQVIIVSERQLPKEFNRYLYMGKPDEIAHFLFYSQFVISDSGTMATEAAILGVPNILINKLSNKVGVHRELANAGLQVCVDSCNEAIASLRNFLITKNLKSDWCNKRNLYLTNCDDLNELFVNIFLNKSDNHEKKNTYSVSTY